MHLAAIFVAALLSLFAAGCEGPSSGPRTVNLHVTGMMKSKSGAT